MTESVRYLPDVLKSVTDPFSLLALMVLVLGLVAYYAIKAGGPAQYKKVPAPLLALGIITIAFVALALNMVRVTNLRTDGATSPALSAKKALEVTFYGMKSRLEPTTVPFQTSSGQLNVGCGERQTTTVSWNLPAGAREVNAASSWQNTSNLRSQNQSAVVQGTTATAVGSIAGRDREWTGNCPGGGHGELVLRGSYVVDQGGRPEKVILKTLHDLVAPNTTIRISLPEPGPDVTSLSCEIIITPAVGEQSRLGFDLVTHDTGVFAVTNRRSSGAQQPEVRVEDRSVVIHIP